MEKILIPLIFYIVGFILDRAKKEDNKKEKVHEKRTNNIKNNVKKLNNKIKKEILLDKEIESYRVNEYKKEDNKINLNTIVEAKSKKVVEKKEQDFNLFNDTDDLVKSVIMAEILGKPKSLK
ncbi:hypothetical protein [Tepidibacter formicigenes]|jgi:uncharacterized membrane protein YhiD involved in acid resistance|uniref:Uncharacterized protein n=1 Tax=Tepidibacter formicigenes DSM 15518 TaxID=1123349 RepID=A0A1M6Q3J3_9FIRM|nr:hypothetical protein [Tepidibacter formicigenes]SHK14718.1 hypothetical protein SAMN02744037_01734 [Tepidibacter formicigenes DSM 15518]